jgi:hypothetical protein
MAATLGVDADLCPLACIARSPCSSKLWLSPAPRCARAIAHMPLNLQKAASRARRVGLGACKAARALNQLGSRRRWLGVPAPGRSHHASSAWRPHSPIGWRTGLGRLSLVSAGGSCAKGRYRNLDAPGRSPRSHNPRSHNQRSARQPLRPQRRWRWLRSPRPANRCLCGPDRQLGGLVQGGRGSALARNLIESGSSGTPDTRTRHL